MPVRPLLIGIALALGAAAAYAWWPGAALPAAAVADRVEVDKSERELRLLADGAVLKTYRVSFGAAPVGHKQREGDERTPEGRYTIDGRNPGSAFFRSLRVSYPDATDRARAHANGVDPGGQIMVHGLPNGLGWIGRWHRFADWTDGCLAVTDREMAEIWRAVPVGTPIEIRP